MPQLQEYTTMLREFKHTHFIVVSTLLSRERRSLSLSLSFPSLSTSLLLAVSLLSEKRKLDTEVYPDSFDFPMK